MNDLQVTRTPEMVAAEINLIKDQTLKLVLSNSILIGKKLKEVKEVVRKECGMTFYYDGRILYSK